MAQSSTVTPNELARTLSQRMHRTITAKAVRTVARDTLAAFDKTKHPAYQGHSYTAEQVRALTATFATRGTRGTPAKAAPKAKAARKASPKAKAQATPVSATGAPSA